MLVMVANKLTQVSLDSVLVIGQISFWLLVKETLNNTQISLDGAGYEASGSYLKFHWFCKLVIS
jgi:hypothetical protein